jgi:transposase-like protein
MPKPYPKQLKDRAVRMVLSHLDEYRSVYGAAQDIAPKLGVGPETLRRWVVAAQRSPDQVKQDELEKTESKRIKDLERKVRDLEQANDILKAASIFFAGELDPRHR